MKAYIVRQMYNEKESLVCYLSYEKYKEKEMAWAIYDVGKKTVIRALTTKLLELQLYGYEIRIINEIEDEEE